ncbi:MAG: helix-turn-helix transcriptional regulator [Phycisphaerales bacterium]|nr:helix-turn-helix transcriptional regulator [Phycisphaerales bacterium]
MDTPKYMTDTAALTAIGERIAQHRLQLDWTQAQLAKEAGVSKRTVIRLEGGESTQLTNLIRILRALDLLANIDELLPPPTPSPLELLRSKEKRRKRASGRAESDDEKGSQEWTWGDEEGPDS